MMRESLRTMRRMSWWGGGVCELTECAFVVRACVRGCQDGCVMMHVH
jgi:hypothetical protein